MPKERSKKSYFNRRINQRINASFAVINDSLSLALHTSSNDERNVPTPSSHSIHDNKLRKETICLSSTDKDDPHNRFKTLHDLSYTEDNDEDESTVSVNELVKDINDNGDSECLPLIQNVCLPIKSNLAMWAVQNNITQNSLRELIVILKLENDIDNFQNLPNDPRTLLNTPRKVDIVYLSPGYYYYFGIQASIRNVINQKGIKLAHDVTFDIAVNIDGLPLSNSNASSLWPILIQVKSIIELKDDIIVTALFHGPGKPTNSNEFLKDFVTEAANLSENGFYINNIRYGFKIYMLICDAPAKSFVLSIKGHTAYSSCTKCIQEGCFINNVMCFPETNNKNRTDSEFRQQLDDNHHNNGTSILTMLPKFDMIKSVPLDYMHLICLGVMKRLLVHSKYGWIFGKQPHKLPYAKVEQLSRHLLSLCKFIPAEFNRKSRTIEECKRYKATEFRLLLLYTGPVVFKEILTKTYYHTFLSLHVATLLFCSPDYSQNEEIVDYGQKLMKCFITSVCKIYGIDFVSHNVHGLLHISDDVLHFGNLDKFSAFPFENFMKVLKKMVRKGDKPLQQIVHRLYENSIKTMNTVESNNGFSLSQEHFEGPLLNHYKLSRQYKALKYNGYIFKLNVSDSFIITKDTDIVKLSNITYYNNEVKLVGQKFLTITDFFSVPCNSSLFNVFKINRHQKGPLDLWSLSDIKSKLCFLPLNEECAVVYPLLHSF
ncbi:hypothetical protein RI129_000759 [Pyrocoelia pectoralis]|uniref:Transposase domain-containing protein n=1 Tax=Pyrocoelia pectoralis TaxID=417401 RepID=A0AAN7ZJJ0_9COLE